MTDERWQLPLVPAGAPGSDLTVGQDGDVLRRTILPGGVRVITEYLPGMRSAAVGAWVGVGSRDEQDGHFGSTHFLEHLLFKGTARRTAVDIAEAFDLVGGEANAATGKETTSYYARVLDADVPLAVDVICDMITSALIDPEELDLERGVILEELAMNEDDPSDVAHEAFAAAVFGEHALGRPIGGTAQTISQVPREAVYAHYSEHYQPHTLVISAAGNVNHEAICAQVSAELQLGGWQLDPQKAPAPRRSPNPDLDLAGAPTAPTRRVIERSGEQMNILVGAPGIAFDDERRFTLSVLNAVLGGGMSSRLFQEIREKRGLAYSTYSFSAGYSGLGLFGLYAGCAPKRADAVEELLFEQWQLMAQTEITEAELAKAKGQLRGGIVLGMEDTGARMSRLGRAEVSMPYLASIDDSLNRINAVTIEEVQSLAQQLYAGVHSVVRVGPV